MMKKTQLSFFYIKKLNSPIGEPDLNGHYCNRCYKSKIRMRYYGSPQ